MFSEVSMMIKKSSIDFEKSLKVKYSQISLELLELKSLDEVAGGFEHTLNQSYVAIGVPRVGSGTACPANDIGFRPTPCGVARYQPI